MLNHFIETRIVLQRLYLRKIYLSKWYDILIDLSKILFVLNFGTHFKGHTKMSLNHWIGKKVGPTSN